MAQHVVFAYMANISCFLPVNHENGAQKEANGWLPPVGVWTYEILVWEIDLPRASR